MSDNPTSRKVNNDQSLTNLRSYNYTDIREGTVCVSGFTQPGGAGTAITAVTFVATRGRGYTVTNPTIVDADITTTLAATGLGAVLAARNFTLSFDVNLDQVLPNVPTIMHGLEVASAVMATPTAFVNSMTSLTTGARSGKFTVNVVVGIWGASDADIYVLIAALMASTSCFNFIAKISDGYRPTILTN